MKKFFYLLIITLVLLLPSKIYAAQNASIVFHCPDTSVGETIECELQGYIGDAYINYIKADYDISKIFTLVDFKFADGLSGSYESDQLQINSDHVLNGQFKIGSFELKATREGLAIITIQNVQFVNNDSTYNIGAIREQVTINSAKVTAPTQEVSNLDVPMLNNLYIVGYPIEFDKKNRHYTIDVPYDLNEIYIMANAFEGYTIEGAGLIRLNKKGSTDVSVVVKKDNSIPNTYTIHVRKTFKNLLWYIITGALGVALVVVVILSYISKNKIIEGIYKDNPELRRRREGAGVLMNGQMINATAIPVKTHNESFRAVNTSNLLNEDPAKAEDKKVVKKVQVVTTKKEEEKKVNTLDLTKKK